MKHCALIQFEILLHSDEARSDRGKLNGLLHDSYFEIGLSGRRYSKTEIIERFGSERNNRLIKSKDFEIDEISDNVVMIIYRSADLLKDGTLENMAIRTSMWCYTNNGWQLRFHQGMASKVY